MVFEAQPSNPLQLYIFVKKMEQDTSFWKCMFASKTFNVSGVRMAGDWGLVLIYNIIEEL